MQSRDFKLVSNANSNAHMSMSTEYFSGVLLNTSMSTEGELANLFYNLPCDATNCTYSEYSF